MLKKSGLGLTVIALLASASWGATITVMQDGSGDATSVQAALAAAENGDTIVIGDSEVYEEDVTAGVAAELVASFTLKAAEGQTPVIRAVNQTERLGALGFPGIDFMGTFLFGCQGVVIEGITFENMTVEANVAGLSACLALFDCSDVTVRNCTVRAAGGEGTGYPADNLGLVVGGVQTAPTGVVIEDCLIEEVNYGIAVAKLQGGTPTDPSVTIRNCTIQHCEETGIEVDNGAPLESPDPSTIAQGEGNLLENNTIIDANTGLSLGGGYTVIRNCTVLASRGEGFDVDLDGDRGTQPITGILENTAFIGSGGDGVRIDEGLIDLSNCIVAGSGSEGIHLRESGNETVVTADHCDIYRNLQLDPESFYEVLVDVGEAALIQLRITNSNVVGMAGLYNGSLEDPGYFDPEGLFATYCNVFVDAERYTNVVVENDLEFDPMYVNPIPDPDQFTREGFELESGSPAIGAGEDGTYIGSQGQAAVGVEDWPIH